MTLFRYKLIKVRCKLSFIALQREVTIKEMFIIAILKVYQIEITQGDIADDTVHTAESDQMFL